MTATIANEQKESWLTCRLDKGMFSDEMAVTYPAEGELQTSVFVDRIATQGVPGQIGKVKIKLVQRNGSLFAVLPSAEQDIVVISETDLAT